MRSSIIEKALQLNGLTVGCYDPAIENLNKTNFKKIMDNIMSDIVCDTFLFYNRAKYVVEMNICAGEVDFNVISLKDYCKEYGYYIEDYIDEY